MHTGISAINDEVQKASAFVRPLFSEIGKVVIGQNYLVERLVIGLLANGHVLLEGVPGLAKTLSVKSLASRIHVNFSRLQFTPDMLPADVIGTQIYNPQSGQFTTRRGPIFANLVLADEINRAPAKVQSALLEAMQERQVTIGETTFKLEEPFLVLATQNPLEQEGTYPLPEAQVDRFMLKVVVGYPDKKEEQTIIRQQVQGADVPQVRPVISLQQIVGGRDLTHQIYMDEKIEKYIIDIVFATRYPDEYGLSKMKNLISYGGSPRASINLALAAKAHAFMERRGFVIPDDVKAICKDVMRHRVGLTYEAEAENITTEKMIDDILRTVIVPYSNFK